MRAHRSAPAVLMLIAATLAAACSSSGHIDTSAPTSAGRLSTQSPTSPAPSTAREPSTTTPAPTRVGVVADRFADRPADVFVPSSITPTTPAPLLILLHGYSGNGDQIEAYFNLEPVAEQRGILLVHPSGTPDSYGNRFWDATEACCRNDSPTVDDSSYLNGIIDAVSQRFTVDPARIWFVGHSNGGFMSYRMACDHSDRVAAIVSLAGTGHLDTSLCRPSDPVSVLQIHGDRDSVIEYNGGKIFDREYPGVLPTLTWWMQHDQCAGKLSSTGSTLDLDAEIEGNETEVLRAGGCPPGIDIELWRINDGSHGPALVPGFAGLVVNFLEAHPKVR